MLCFTNSDARYALFLRSVGFKVDPNKELVQRLVGHIERWYPTLWKLRIKHSGKAVPALVIRSFYLRFHLSNFPHLECSDGGSFRATPSWASAGMQSTFPSATCSPATTAQPPATPECTRLKTQTIQMVAEILIQPPRLLSRDKNHGQSETTATRNYQSKRKRPIVQRLIQDQNY
jgi:hypothetical protein